MTRKLSGNQQAALLDAAMRVDLSHYDPVATFIKSRGGSPTIQELADYIAEIRVMEVTAVANAIGKVVDLEEEDAPEAT